MTPPKQRCLDCAEFVIKNGEGACAVDPIPRKGTCGRCERAFTPLQATLGAKA
jgi:hypothetical protein